MRWTVTAAGLADCPGDLIVFPVYQEKSRKAEAKRADLAPLLALAGPSRGKGTSRAGHPDLASIIRSAAFTAEAKSLLPVHCSGVKAGWFLLVGMGDPAEAGLQTLRDCAGTAARQARSMKADRVVLAVPDGATVNFDDETFARCWCEGAELALAPLGEIRKQKPKPAGPRAWTLAAAAGRHRDLRAGLKEALAATAGCLFARALVNLPPNLLDPADLARKARAMARAEGLRCRVLGVPELKKLKMGGLLGVGQGSAKPPCLIVVDYQGSRSAKAPSFALVGKGITFDSGGISLKPGAGMDEMKADMAGAAGVLGAVLSIARLKLPVNVRVVVPAAENMPDGGAVKPADVITTASGQTVEILNTDAEGRLILADALWYAGRGKPDYIIDMATLTGACVVALGTQFAGLLGNSADLIDVLKQAGSETHERVWHLPLIDEHKEMMKGTWGDLQNIGGGRDAGALTAAAFLSAFVSDKSAWSHLDIAGPAYSTKVSPTCPKGGTGFGARLLTRAVQILAG